MKRIFTYFTALAVAFAAISACEDPFAEIDGKPGTQKPGNTDKPVDPNNPDNPDTPDVPVVNPDENYTPDPASGLSVNPVKPDADGGCTITLNAVSTNEFMGYTGDVYLHIGIIIDGEWKFVESQWDVNDDKFKMASTGTGTWALEIPNIREFFTLAERRLLSYASEWLHVRQPRRPSPMRKERLIKLSSRPVRTSSFR